MKLHENQTEFRELITLTARDKHISEPAVERDYYIVRALKQLADSEEADSCVFKGGTSLSKQDFDVAVETFEKISSLFAEIGE